MDSYLSNIFKITMEKLNQIADAKTIIGEPITVDKITMIPVSKVTMGFATGGSDGGKSINVAAGSGGGVSITPVAFVVISENDVKVIPMANAPSSSIERLIDVVPDVMDKISSLIEERKEKNRYY